MAALLTLKKRDTGLTFPRPFPADSLAVPKRFIGLLLDRLVGMPWVILYLAGYGNTKAGSAVVFLILAFLYSYISR